MPNPTLLDPSDASWYVHPSTCPFRPFLPLSHPFKQRAVEGAKKEEVAPLAKACQEQTKKYLKSFSAYFGKGKLKFEVWLGDPLQLAVYRIPGWMAMGGWVRGWEEEEEDEEEDVEWEEEEEDGEEDVEWEEEEKHLGVRDFDVINTQNLTDKVGLLNVLVACGPLLKR